MVRQRVRIRFAKQGDLRFLGHRDLVRLLERLFRRAGLRLRMSEGYHPKPRMTFPSALALAVEGRDEVMELELAEDRSPDALLGQLTAQSVAGLTFHSVEVLSAGAGKARAAAACYEIRVPPGRSRTLADRVAALMAQPTCPVPRPGKGTTVDVRRTLRSLRFDEGVLRIELLLAAEGGAGPRDVLAALGLDDLESAGVPLVRTRVELKR